MFGVGRLKKFSFAAVLVTSLTGLAGSHVMAATPPNFTPPENLAASVNGNVVTITWEIPAGISGVAMWDVGWADMETGVPTGGWGIWVESDITTATITIGDDTSGDGPARIKVRAGSGPCIGVGTGDCVYGPEATVDVNIDASAVTPVATDVTVVMSETASTEAPAAAIEADANDDDGDEDGGNTGLTIAIAALAVAVLLGVAMQFNRSRQKK